MKILRELGPTPTGAHAYRVRRDDGIETTIVIPGREPSPEPKPKRARRPVAP